MAAARRMIRDPLDTGGPAPSDLPAGDARREAAARATDTLAEAAEARGAEMGTINPRAFEVESEIAQYFNELEVKDADPAYVYCWVQSGFYGRFVNAKLALGWEVVQGDDPEAWGLRGIGVDTTRRLGDTMLMRCRRDRFKQLQRRDEKHRADASASVTSEMQELTARAAKLGARLVMTDQMDAATLDRLAAQSHAQAQAGAMTEQWMRDGRMPGAPAARR